MAYRCESCNRFRSGIVNDYPESSFVDGESDTLRLEVTLSLECEECGDELASATHTIEIDRDDIEFEQI